MKLLEDRIAEALRPFIGVPVHVALPEIKAAVYRVVCEVAVEGFAPAAPAAEPEKKPEEKESIEDIEKRARKPPSDGPCKGCGQNLPINRLMLCFKCWVKKNLLDDAKAGKTDWIPGDPHPSYCGCGLPEHNGGPRE